MGTRGVLCPCEVIMQGSDDVGALVGCTIQSVTGCSIGSEEIVFVTDRGSLRLYHVQDCCESVCVDDVTGDVADLVGAVVSVAEERVGDPPEGHSADPGGSETWTFYEIRTTRGDVTIRWFGSSNGYYSESVAVDWVPA